MYNFNLKPLSTFCVFKKIQRKIVYSIVIYLLFIAYGSKIKDTERVGQCGRNWRNKYTCLKRGCDMGDLEVDGRISTIIIFCGSFPLACSNTQLLKVICYDYLGGGSAIRNVSTCIRTYTSRMRL